MQLRTFCGALLTTVIVAGTATADDSAAQRELAPSGKLRVAVAVSPSPSALYVIKDEATGKLRGVSIDLGAELAGKLGVPVEYVPYLASGEITDTADKGVWDVTFLPYDATRAKQVAFGGAYHVLQSTCLVAPGSAIASRSGFDPSRTLSVASRRQSALTGSAGCERPDQVRPGSRVVTSWTSHVLPSGSLKAKNDP